MTVTVDVTDEAPKPETRLSRLWQAAEVRKIQEREHLGITL